MLIQKKKTGNKNQKTHENKMFRNTVYAPDTVAFPKIRSGGSRITCGRVPILCR